MLKVSTLTLHQAFYHFFLVLTVIAFATRNNLLMGTWVISSAAYIYINLADTIKIDIRSMLAILIVLSATVVVPFSIFSELTAAIHYYICISTLVLTYLMTQRPKQFFNAVRLTLFGMLGLILIFLNLTEAAYFPLDELVPGASSNVVTSFLITVQATYCALKFTRYKKIALLSTILTAYICIVGFGRGSIVAAIGILAINIAFLFLRSKRGILIAIPIFLTLIPLVISFTYQPILSSLSRTKLAHGMYDSARTEIYQDYLSKINILTLFTGASYEDTAIADKYNGNPHSSYIRGHHIFGLFFLTLMMSCFYLVFLLNCPSIYKFYGASMYLIIFFRALSEPILFPTPLDIFFVGIFFSMARMCHSGYWINRDNEDMRSIKC